jgi:hypothetical protein
VEASNLYYLKARLVGRLVALATIKGWIDEAIEKGLTLILIFHKIIETPVTDTQTSIADFCEVINYLVAKKAHCVTIDEWYKGLIDPRYSSAS